MLPLERTRLEYLQRLYFIKEGKKMNNTMGIRIPDDVSDEDADNIIEDANKLSYTNSKDMVQKASSVSAILVTELEPRLTTIAQVAERLPPAFSLEKDALQQCSGEISNILLQLLKHYKVELAKLEVAYENPEIH